MKKASLLFFSVLLVSISFLLGAKIARALIVSPARIEIASDPGKPVSGKMSLINNAEKSMTFYSSAQNFEAGGETGTPLFVDSKDELASWVEIQKQITLNPGERKEVEFKVNLPEKAGVGGHFAAIFWGTEPPVAEGEGGVSIGAKVGSLLFLKVNGQIVEKGNIIEFRTFGNKKMFDVLPVDFVYRFENSGNDRSKPAGTVKILNTFGFEKEVITANKKEGSVLPESIRRFYTSWGREDIEKLESKSEEEIVDPKMGFFEKVKVQATNFHFGRYTAILSLNYGLEKNNTVAKYQFFIFPWQLLTLVVFALALIFFGGKFILKRYENKLMEKARQSLQQEIKKE